MKEVPFEDHFGMLIDIEYSSRKNNRLKRLIHNAGFDQLGGSSSPLTDAILDSIVHDAYMISIQSIDASKDISMREIYRLDKYLRE